MCLLLLTNIGQDSSKECTVVQREGKVTAKVKTTLYTVKRGMTAVSQLKARQGMSQTDSELLYGGDLSDNCRRKRMIFWKEFLQMNNIGAGW